MAALTAGRDPYEVTDQRRLPEVPVAASTKIFAGGLVCLNSSGEAIPAAAGVGNKTYGVAMETVDNYAGAAGDKTLELVYAGIFHFANDGSNPVAAAGLLEDCYVIDDQTVSDTQATNAPVVGKVVAIRDEGVMVRVNVGS